MQALSQLSYTPNAFIPTNCFAGAACRTSVWPHIAFAHLADLKALSKLAEWTGLEPATPGVTGRYSNQLNYHSWQETLYLLS